MHIKNTAASGKLIKAVYGSYELNICGSVHHA